MDFLFRMARKISCILPIKLITSYLVCRTMVWFLIGSIAYFLCSIATGERLLGGIEAYLTYTLFWAVFVGLIGGTVSLVTNKNIE